MYLRFVPATVRAVRWVPMLAYMHVPVEVSLSVELYPRSYEYCRSILYVGCSIAACADVVRHEGVLE